MEFKHQLGSFALQLSDLRLKASHQLVIDGIVVNLGVDVLDGNFANKMASAARELIESITPMVNELEDETNEADV